MTRRIASMKLMTRDDLADYVWDSIPDGMMFIGGMRIPCPGVSGYRMEDLRLIEDLGMDSMDITSVIYDVCAYLEISGDDLISGDVLDGIGTVKELIDLLWAKYTGMTERERHPDAI